MKAPAEPKPPKEDPWMWVIVARQHWLPTEHRMRKLAKCCRAWKLSAYVRNPRPEEYGETFEDGTGI